MSKNLAYTYMALYYFSSIFFVMFSSIIITFMAVSLLICTQNLQLNFV